MEQRNDLSNYRVVKTILCHTDGTEEDVYTIRLAHYPEENFPDGLPWWLSEVNEVFPLTLPIAPSSEALKEDLESMLEAFKFPIVEEEEVWGTFPGGMDE